MTVNAVGRATPRTLGMLKSQLERALVLAGYQGWDVGLEVCAPDRMQAMNKEYRGLDRVTDVLTFPFYELDGPEGFPADIEDEDRNLGDILLCIEEIKRRQPEAVDYNERIDLLLVHSLCHCLGYDHQDEEQQLHMEKREDEILAKLERGQYE